MSYQTSIHFDPTALLIIKKEVDNSIQLVESAVTLLVEDQTLPFGIDDALNQFEQCAHILLLIDMPNLAKIAKYSAELMRKIMLNPTEIVTQDVIALSEGTTMLKRYIEFSCLKEVRVAQFLLDTINRLEISLAKPITQQGESIVAHLECVSPVFKLPHAPELEKTTYVHKLYKLCLNQFLKKQQTDLDAHTMKLVSSYLAHLSEKTPSAQYWNLVFVAFNHIENTDLNDARFRILIAIESNIQHFFKEPHAFKVSNIDLANILSLCICQDDDIAQHIREQMNIGEDLLTDTQLQVFSRHLYGPDFETIHTVSQLITESMSQIRNDIEYNYQNMSADKTAELKSQLTGLANIFKVLNLDNAYVELKQQSELLSQQNMLDENYAQQLMNSILSAMNSIGIFERNYTSNRLQLNVNNIEISLDQLDEAHRVLLTESKALIELSHQTLLIYVQDQDMTSLGALPSQFKEVAGAMLFLGATDGQKALCESAEFIQKSLEKDQNITLDHIHNLLDVLASADMMIDNLQNKQPVLQSMFDVALKSSQNLKAIA